MKLTKIKALLIVSLGLTFHSCLDLDPQDQLSDPTIWKTPNDYQLFANQFYGWTRDFGSAVYDAPHSDTRSDLMTSSTYNDYSKGINVIPLTDGNYTDNYNRIRRTNLLLQNAMTYPNQEDIKQYVAEAKFFRAYCYFDLVQLYGDVIITKTPLDITSSEMKTARNDRGEVIDFIIKDLEEAISDLPVASALSAAQEGRVTQGAAQAFLSRVALYEGTWQKSRNNMSRGKSLLDVAAKAALAVINSKQYSLFKPDALGDSAQKYLFILEDVKSNPAGMKKSENKEYLFSRRHDEVIAPIGKNITQNCLGNVQWITHKFAAMYLCSDGLPAEGRVVSPKFNGYAKMKTEFENRDNRMRYTLLKPGTSYWGNKFGRTTWLGDEADLKTAKKNLVPNSCSGYYNQKWSTERIVNDNYEGYDYPIIRYAETLLNYAEAVFERDDAISDADLNLSLNLVRLRVNASMPKLSNHFVTSNGLDMQTEIRRERTVELFNEGFRLDDLKRWKTAETEMPQDMLGIKWKGTEFETTWSTASYPRNADGFLIIESGRKWENKHYLYPLPSDQTQLNTNLGQNPDW